MSLRDCLNSAVAQGAINSRQAEELNQYFEARFNRKRGTMGDAEARAAARDEVVAALRAEAKEQRRQVLLAEAKRKEIAEFIENHKTVYDNDNKLDGALSLMIHNGYAGRSSMAGRANAIIAMAQRDLAEVMYHFRRTKFTGRYRNTVDLPDLVRVLHGESTDNPAAKAMGGALKGVLEDLRLRFNNAGGNIPKREDWGLTHSHNVMKIRDLGVTGRNKFGRKEVVVQDIGERQAGLGKMDGLPIPGLSARENAEFRIQGLWEALRGRDMVWASAAKFTADVRNAATSAMLGTTGVLAATTDPWVAAAARRLAGLPTSSTIFQMLKRFARDKDKRAMARRGVIWEDFMHTMNEQARFVDQMFGHEWSKWMVDRSMVINALKPLTEARKRIEAAVWHDTLGGYAEKMTDWMDLPPLLKKTMEGFGFTPEDWHKMRGATDELGFLDPGGVIEKTGDRALAEKYAEMIAQWMERSVPSGDPRIKSIVTSRAPRGTFGGELTEFATQFVSFGMSFTARQLEAHYVYSMLAKSRGGKVARGAWYFASMAVPLMFGAAIYDQVKAIRDGKDLQDMTEASFWVKAFVKGGGGGLFADFVDRAENRFGQSFASSLPGPGVAFVGDTFDVTLRTVQSIIGQVRQDEEQVEQAKAGRKFVDYVGRYTPVLASNPATALVYRRYFIDNLQWLLDPDAEDSFKAKKRRASFWWEPGALTPSRLPDLTTATGED